MLVSRKKMSYTRQPLGPLLKVKLLVGYMYTSSNLKSQKQLILKHHHRNITIKYNFHIQFGTGRMENLSPFRSWFSDQCFNSPPVRLLGSSLGTSCQELFNSFSLVSSRAFGVFVSIIWRGNKGAKKNDQQSHPKVNCMNQLHSKIIRGFDMWQNPRLQDLEKKSRVSQCKIENLKPLTCWGSADHQRVSKIQCFAIIQSSKGKPQNDGFQTYSYLLFQVLILRWTMLNIRGCNFYHAQKNGGGWKMTFLFNWMIFRGCSMSKHSSTSQPTFDSSLQGCHTWGRSSLQGCFRFQQDS